MPINSAATQIELVGNIAFIDCGILAKTNISICTAILDWYIRTRNEGKLTDHVRPFLAQVENFFPLFLPSLLTRFYL